VLARVDLRGRPDGPAAAPGALRARLPRARLDVAEAGPAVAAICRDVAERGLAAVQEASRRFDGIAAEALRVPPAALQAALAALDPSLRAALEEAATRVRKVHAAAPPPTGTVSVVPGGRVTRRYLPVRRVGLYVPGGLVAYPSSVVMNVVPAQVAGVEAIAVASPPRPEHGGAPHPAVLAACALLGVSEVYAMGGAQAIAAFGYGIEEVGLEPVDLITGPGNRYVAAAKRLLAGTVGIDAEAGPTEIAVVADSSADPAVIAADLVAQAEHDPLAACLLITPVQALADAVDIALEAAVPATRHSERVRAALAGQSAAVLVDDLDAALAVSDAWAPEHLQLLTVDAAERAGQVRAAGAVFVGRYTPVALGDYLAGSNHVLPTGGTARYASGLSAATFLRLVNVVEYEKTALAAALPFVQALGEAEDLPAHVRAVSVRL
jgi:histidinol dehydrogenase